MMTSRAADLSSSASFAVTAIGFSQSTCFPARAAASVIGHVQMVGKWVVDGIYLRIGKHLLVRAVGTCLRADPIEPARARRCRDRERQEQPPPNVETS